MSVLVQRHAAVTEITLDWPDRRNAMGPSEGRELRVALETADGDHTVAAIVLSANGKAFCAGGNLPQIVELARGGADAVRNTIYAEFQGIFRVLRNSRVPVIAAVDGPAVGFGCDLALAGAVTFIGANGWLAQGWSKAGLIPATGGTLDVARRGGRQAVWRLLCADRVDSRSAEAWGLGIACEQARPAALEMAQKLAALPREPLKALVQLARIDDPTAHLEAALAYQVGFITHPDFAGFANKLVGR